jgi:hypothetical protein
MRSAHRRALCPEWGVAGFRCVAQAHRAAAAHRRLLKQGADRPSRKPGKTRRYRGLSGHGTPSPVRRTCGSGAAAGEPIAAKACICQQRTAVLADPSRRKAPVKDSHGACRSLWPGLPMAIDRFAT